MSSWLSWFTGNSLIFSGPATEAPNVGVNIKILLDQRPKAVMIASQSEIVDALSKLKKTEINSVPPISNRPPIMKEFDQVFALGYHEFFKSRKAATRQFHIQNIQTLNDQIQDTY